MNQFNQPRQHQTHQQPYNQYYQQTPPYNQSTQNFQQNSRQQTHGSPPKENFIKKLFSKKEEQQYHFDPILGYRKLPPKQDSGSVIKKLAEPETLDYILNNTERVLQTAQQLGPLIEQYGPLVKNLPSLLTVFSALQGSDSDESAATTTSKKSKKASATREPSYEPADNLKKDFGVDTKKKSNKPKLFV